jgi:beta-glucanase (GH16 family)
LEAVAFTSAGSKQKNLFDQAYGRFEARIKMPWGPGIWPAFWMLGSNINEVSWPQCGEIDIMEYRGRNQTGAWFLAWPWLFGWRCHYQKFWFSPMTVFDVDYHVFAVEWGVDYIDFFVDDTLYQRINRMM